MKLPELHNPFNISTDNKDDFLASSIFICIILLVVRVVLLFTLKPAVLFGTISVVAISRVLYAVFKGR